MGPALQSTKGPTIITRGFCVPTLSIGFYLQRNLDIQRFSYIIELSRRVKVKSSIQGDC